ncbi:glutamyl-tRNA(Gln) amidotransferase, B subunit [Oscillochloris trichoides DG-6]|uniref:Aspartyl/glutamyl-tRNA(Asn/Gln) amidotransferase subunit B n=1 Tax=Oscillochloris trichoides DG-6 TaxID=765420 RepID=E1IH18_9CHLR|nr:Asp-tRNA(Asn)/Glu-tRNA(Gln) amidotransferase subunit GatB [Oscillochloris trichoides]EFO79493.1 glutamyl-tRNA(Gln) amidotransferase, B subunit [Oscillochloris trichoides DG-6]
MTAYLVTIGLEIHAHIKTASKMFDGCPADYAGATPNSYVSAVSLGLPGTLPVLNQRAVELAACAGMALNCRVNHRSVFSRKLYPYPDLPKGFQITQYDEPICSDGWVEIRTAAGETRRIGIERLHIEEDTGRLLHADDDSSLIDYNRSGTPLMEIVSRPDVTTPEEARLVFEKIRQILVWIGASSGNLDEGAVRCDANVSVRPEGQVEYGAKVEIKNINSFRFVERALTYEIQRQIETLNAGGTVVQETRGWREDLGRTEGQRSKEYAHDYRYFPEPDIPPLELSDAWIAERRAELPELPDARRARFENDYGLSLQDADLLTLDRSVADYFEQAAAAAGGNAKEVANWVLNEGFRLLKERGEPATALATRMPVAHLSGLIALVLKGAITRGVAKQLFEECFDSGADPALLVTERGLTQISDSDALRVAVREALADPKAAKAIGEYRGGKTTAIQFLVGMVMRASKGQANAQVVRTLLEEELASQ